ncbi:hypothetical protein WJX72_010069 [[Myrmecia] bisecta]|uniref:Uncharacterized protein n=1 Tax=[Myrmecia] bisecta TaxID=41462 RepID=A0AAW1PLC8_9CHLO
MAKQTFKFVHIPADISEPITEIEQEYTEDKAVECLIDRLKAHFAKQRPQPTAEQRKRQREELLKHVPAGTNIPDSLMDAATNLNMVENIALITNTPANNYVGVNLYCDDTASITEAPFNPRASDITTCCGKPLQVRGDAFLARVFDNEDDFKRLDFSLQEVSSSAPWVKAAHDQNERKRQSESAQSVMQRLQAQGRSGTTVEELAPSVAAREEGNAAFKSGDYGKAVEHYSNAIDMDGTALPAYNNRALARLKLGQCEQAQADCDVVLAADANNVKALLRRGAARVGLQQPLLAIQDYEKAAELEPKNKDTQAKLQQLREQLTTRTEGNVS